MIKCLMHDKKKEWTENSPTTAAYQDRAGLGFGLFGAFHGYWIRRGGFEESAGLTVLVIKIVTK